MARTLLSPQSFTAAGAALTYSNANADGHSFRNSERTLLHVKNGSGAPITVTFITPGVVDGNAIADPARSVPAGGDRMFGKLDTDAYTDADGIVLIDFSDVTTVTVALIEP